MRTIPGTPQIERDPESPWISRGHFGGVRGEKTPIKSVWVFDKELFQVSKSVKISPKDVEFVEKITQNDPQPGF